MSLLTRAFIVYWIQALFGYKSTTNLYAVYWRARQNWSKAIVIDDCVFACNHKNGHPVIANVITTNEPGSVAQWVFQHPVDAAIAFSRFQVTRRIQGYIRFQLATPNGWSTYAPQERFETPCSPHRSPTTT